MTQHADMLNRLEGLISKDLIGRWKGLDTETLISRLHDQCDELIHFPGTMDIRARVAEICFALMWEHYDLPSVFSNADSLLVSVSTGKGEEEYKRVLYGTIFKCWRLCDNEFVQHDINLAIVRRSGDVFLPGFLRNEQLEMPLDKTWELLILARIGKTDVGEKYVISDAFLKSLVNKLMHARHDGVLIIADAVAMAYPHALPHLHDDEGDHGMVRLSDMLAEHRWDTNTHTEFLRELLDEVKSYGFDTVFHPRVRLVAATEDSMTVEVNVSKVPMADPNCGLDGLRERLQDWYGEYGDGVTKPTLTVIPVDVVGKDGPLQHDVYGRIEGSFTLG